MKGSDELRDADGEVVRFANEAEFEAWLQANHDQNSGIWLVIAKSGGAGRSITYADAIEIGLCFGWIDGRKARHDDNYWLGV